MDSLIPETDAGHLRASALNIYAYTLELSRASYLYKPRLFIDGDKWCALYGENLQDGVAGFGISPYEAYADFDMAWGKKLERSNHS